MIEIKNSTLQELRNSFSGEVYTDQSTRLQYATDASAYREVPGLVTRPKDEEDIRNLVLFANKYRPHYSPCCRDLPGRTGSW
jgi:FAD/FMN-containing dehydrogenase